jgi:predicted MFS family arabinose efflux permease
LAWTTVAESRSSNQRALDLPGQCLAIMALGTFTLGFIEGTRWGWTSAWTAACMTAAAVAASGFVLIERRSAAPLLPVQLFRTSQFSAACAVAACMTFGMYATLFLLPLYLQAGRGASAMVAGLDMLPMSVAFVLVSHVSGRIATRIGARLAMTAGMAAMGAGQLLLALLAADTGLPYVEAAFLIIGVGLGLNSGPVLTVAVSAAPKDYTGATAGIVNTARIVGATLGVAVLGALFAMGAGQNPTEARSILAGLPPALIGGAIVEFTGALAAWWLIAPDAIAKAGR